MSKKNTSNENPENLELEEQFIIRFPEELAKAVRASMEAGNIHEKLSIQLDVDSRYGQVRMNDQVLRAKIVDLPTIVESYKTEDKVNLYKTADISQMVVCTPEPVKENIWQMREPAKTLVSSDEEDKENDVANKVAPKVDESFLCASGITPPTRNIRRRRLRNVIKEKHEKQSVESNVVNEVKYLLGMDGEAVNVSFEVENEDGSIETQESLKAKYNTGTKPKRKP